MAKFAYHDAYSAAAPEEFRPLLLRLRSRLATALPDADELISYDMPGFGYGKTIVAGYAAFSKQCGLYVQRAAVAAYEENIAAAGLKATKLPRDHPEAKLLCQACARYIRGGMASRYEAGVHCFERNPCHRIDCFGPIALPRKRTPHPVGQFELASPPDRDEIHGSDQIS